jgi:hypothetical protein
LTGIFSTVLPESARRYCTFVFWPNNLGTTTNAATTAHNCAAMNHGASAGRMPANDSVSERAIVTAGLAKDVDAVNQYAEVM